MLEDIVIIGTVMAVTEIIKHMLKRWLNEDLVTQLLPLIVLGLAGGLNVLNARCVRTRCASHRGIGARADTRSHSRRRVFAGQSRPG